MKLSPDSGKPLPQTFEKYGLDWNIITTDAWVEISMIRKGGRWKSKSGIMYGKGLEYHFTALIKLIWPDVVFHKWNKKIIRAFLRKRTIVVIGPASSGKTHTAAICALADWYCFPSCTTVICCSTTRERLEDRVWGEIKKHHKLAKERFPWLDGNLIESRQRIVLDNKNAASEGRDFRNGLVGVPCKKGENFVGLGDFAGLKNKRVTLLGDELSLLPRVFVDSISNLDKNPLLRVVALGNPKETTDALGVLAEPAVHLGGWESGIDQTPETKEWEIRRPDGVCIQLPGSDSPNLDGKLGIPLITQEQIDRDVAFYGKDSLWFTMMDQGMMPRGQGSRRVLTRTFCLRHQAMSEPLWASTDRVKIGFLDAAYRAVGGDRCIFGELQFGYEVQPPEEASASAIINQNSAMKSRRQIMALIDLVNVPIILTSNIQREPEDQITEFCKAQCERRGIPPENFFYDSGMRSSLVTAMMRTWSTAVNALDFGGPPSQRPVSAGIDVACSDYYSKFVTELWFSVRLIVEAEQFRGLTDEVIMEGSAREWKMVGKNQIEVETKKEMKLKTGRSPDLFDALVAGVEGARRRGFIIASIMVRPEQTPNQNWKREVKDQAKQFWTGKQLTYK